MAQPGVNIAKAKAAMRGNARAHRRVLFDRLAGEAGDTAAKIGLRFLEMAVPGKAAGYYPVYSEFNTLPLLNMLGRNGWVTGLPVVTRPNAPLTFREWRVGEDLEPGDHRIPVPAASARTFQPDILLVPLLAYDRTGFRLGYGGGYYDRTLAMLRKAGQVVAIGLAFADQAVDSVPHDALDQQLDWILTESGPLRCR